MPFDADDDDRHAAAARLLPDVEQVGAVVDVLRQHRQLPRRCALVDDVGRQIAERQIAAARVRNPYRTFGEAEVLAERFQLRVGRDDRVERRVEPDDPEVARGGPLRLHHDHAQRHGDGSGRESHATPHSKPCGTAHEVRLSTKAGGPQPCRPSGRWGGVA